MPTLQTVPVAPEVFTFKEGGFWIAAWRQYDIVAQGHTEQEAVQRLHITISTTAILAAREGGDPFAGTPRPPPELVVQWEEWHYRDHPQRLRSV